MRGRLAARGVYAEEWTNVEAHARSLELAGLGHPVVDTGAGTPAEGLRRVVAGLLDDDPALPDASRVVAEAKDEEESRAVLIGGTTAVGKSTIGWHAFMAAREDGEPCAFVDLRQLGFMGVDGGVVDHRLQARATGALWRVFRAHGARLLIVNGPVNTAAELQQYRTALLPTRLEAVRLVAGGSALVGRVRARMQGDMARLAGDRLVGRSAPEAVADTALHLQNESVPDTSFPSFDTTALDAVESARRILRAD